MNSHLVLVIAHVKMRQFFLERDISDLNFGFFRYLVFIFRHSHDLFLQKRLAKWWSSSTCEHQLVLRSFGCNLEIAGVGILPVARKINRGQVGTWSEYRFRPLQHFQM